MGESGAPVKTGVPHIYNKVEHMFLGRYEHSIDEKGRLTIPVRFRELLKDGAYVTQGFDRNLMVMTSANFDQISKNVDELSFTDPAIRSLKRLIFSSADQVEVDKAGRILIPQFLRDSVQINGGVTIVGAGNYFEIWNPELWNAQSRLLQDTEYTAQRFAAFNLSARSS